eukprot:c964_g1_i1.p1 GENE.c964_g1_i1~~c964_g1_i1.p1  ORF type:complete len:175 (-),score=51.72 c964_g1_i1:130-654(-)
MLNPSTPPEGIDLVTYLSRKYGPQVAERVLHPNNPVSTAGRPLGLVFNPARRVVNTISAHRLMEAAKSFGNDTQNKLAEELFRSYHCDALDVSDRAVLLECAKKSGIDEATIDRIFNDQSGREVVLRLDAKVKSQGIQGVPLFVIKSEQTSGQVVLSGAQPPQQFLAAFSQVSG